MERNSIVICGGHFAPAIALIEKLKENKRKKYSIYYIGRKNPLEGDKSLSLEYLTCFKANTPFYTIRTGRLQRRLTRFTLTSLFKIPLGFLDSLKLLIQLKPKIVISFGGYVALPICIAAWILKIPIVTHEQTLTLGISNRIISRIARVTFLTWPNTKKVPKGVRSVVTGIPIRKAIFSEKNDKIVNFGDKNLPLIYVTGGSLGSMVLNKVIAFLLPKLLHSYRVLHQCGNANNANDYKMLQRVKNSLPKKTEKNYKLVKHVYPDQVGSILSGALLVIARSGANTVAEIASIGVPAIFVPLPWAGQAEQEENALVLEKIGIAKILKQGALNGEILLETIDYIGQNYGSFKKNGQIARQLFPVNAADRMLKIIEEILSISRNE